MVGGLAPCFARFSDSQRTTIVGVLHGGLVAQIGSDDAEFAASLSETGRSGDEPYRTYRVAEGAKWIVDASTPAEEKNKPYKKGMQLFNDVHALASAGNGLLYAVHKDGPMKVFDTSDGKVVAERQVPSPVWDGLAIAGGILFLSSRSGDLHCLGPSK